MKLGYIGSGPISAFHIPAAQASGFSIEAIGTTVNSARCREFAASMQISDCYRSDGWKSVCSAPVDAFCLCVDTSATAEILLSLLDNNKPVLVEKPVAWKNSDLQDILNHPNSSKIYVAYNRRFYDGVAKAKRFADAAKGGIVEVQIPDSIPGLRQFMVNGCHVIDLCRYILGDLSVHSRVLNESDSGHDIDLFSVICKNTKWTVSITHLPGSPENFSININTPGSRFQLKPLEVSTLYKGMEIIDPSTEFPLRRYIPKPASTYVEKSEFKPGFLTMYTDFYSFIATGNHNYANTISSAAKTLSLCWDIVDSPLAQKFSNFKK